MQMHMMNLSNVTHKADPSVHSIAALTNCTSNQRPVSTIAGRRVINFSSGLDESNYNAGGAYLSSGYGGDYGHFSINSPG